MSKVEEDWQEMTCPVCGRSFHVHSYQRQRRYCSVTCRNKAQYRRKCERAGKPIGRQVKRCEVCGEEFMPSRRNVRCCSRKCRLARYRMTHHDRDYMAEARRAGEECDRAAKVAVSALPRHVADGLRWIMSTNCGRYKVLQAWLEDSDTARLKEIRERMG